MLFGASPRTLYPLAFIDFWRKALDKYYEGSQLVCAR
jgi:hypothetical protein